MNTSSFNCTLEWLYPNNIFLFCFSVSPPQMLVLFQRKVAVCGGAEELDEGSAQRFSGSLFFYSRQLLACFSPVRFQMHFPPLKTEHVACVTDNCTTCSQVEKIKIRCFQCNVPPQSVTLSNPVNTHGPFLCFSPQSSFYTTLTYSWALFP